MDQIEIYLEYGNLKWLIIYLLATPLFARLIPNQLSPVKLKLVKKKKKEKKSFP